MGIPKAEQIDANDDRVLTFKEWCALNGISRNTGRRIFGSGAGPEIVQLSPRRIGITVRANRRWQMAQRRTTGG
jgi:predicted DNA-binding transcriptional regulator AlpA